MKPGDLVKNKSANSKRYSAGQYGTFVGYRKFKNYECAEVIWFNRTAPNGDLVSSIQKDLIEVVNK
jgi:hypothetical protein